jgi:hypothetical protein
VGCGLALLWWWDPAKIGVPFCAFHLLTGLHCPGCGAVRATHELLHGRLFSALHYNVLWIASLPLILYLLVSEWRTRTGRTPLPGQFLRSQRFWIAVAILAIVFFMLRNVPGEPFSRLAPPAQRVATE